MRDLIYTIILMLLLWIILIRVPIDKQLEAAKAGCGKAENVQWLELDKLGLRFGWGCYKSVEEVGG